MIRGPISLLIVGSILSAVIAVAWFRPQVLEGILPDRLVRTLEGGQLLAGDRQGGSRPADFLVDDSDGMKASGPIAATAGNAPVFIDDVIVGYRTDVAADIPAEITTIRPITGCRFTRPESGSLVGHVTAGHSGLQLALSTYNDGHLAEAVQNFVDAYRSAPGAAVAALQGPSYEAYDVAVTETGSPVYLVLENGQGNRIWNIHLAPGARIERVVLLGGDHAGVANLDPVVPVEVLPGEALSACGVRPVYTPNPGHRFFLSMQNGTMSKSEAEAKLAAVRDAVAAYDIWFRDTFGTLAEASRAGFDEGTISVVGPVPVEAGLKSVYAPVSGSRVRSTQDNYFDIRGQAAEGEDFAGRVKAIATTFAFGDLENLRQGVEF
jgi:hypothetical protein